VDLNGGSGERPEELGLLSAGDAERREVEPAIGLDAPKGERPALVLPADEATAVLYDLDNVFHRHGYRSV
jgi:hypothetical protein